MSVKPSVVIVGSGAGASVAARELTRAGFPVTLLEKGRSVLPGLGTHAFDISGVLDPNAWYAALIAGMFNITPAPTVLETVAWLAYGVPVLALFLRRGRKPAAAQAPTTAPVGA